MALKRIAYGVMYHALQHIHCHGGGTGDRIGCIRRILAHLCNDVTGVV